LRTPLINLSPDEAARLANQATAAGLVNDVRA
jgi:hypothetical protein